MSGHVLTYTSIYSNLNKVKRKIKKEQCNINWMIIRLIYIK